MNGILLLYRKNLNVRFEEHTKNQGDRILLFISCPVQNLNSEGCIYKLVHNNYQPPVKEGTVAARVLFTNLASKTTLRDAVTPTRQEGTQAQQRGIVCLWLVFGTGSRSHGSDLLEIRGAAFRSPHEPMASRTQWLGPRTRLSWTSFCQEERWKPHPGKVMRLTQLEASALCLVVSGRGPVSSYRPRSVPWAAR